MYHAALIFVTFISTDICTLYKSDADVYRYSKHNVCNKTFLFPLLFSFIGCLVCTFIRSRRVALWIGRQLFKQKTRVQDLLLASIRLTEVSTSKNAESLPVPGTWLSALTSLWEDKQRTCTMINEGFDNYLISAIVIIYQALSSSIYMCYFQVQMNPCGIFMMYFEPTLIQCSLAV